jgi:hypothetical protein
VPRPWQPLVELETGRVDRAAYTVCALEELRVAYPDGYEGLIPRAAGSFSDRTIDQLRIYIPVRQVLG